MVEKSLELKGNTISYALKINKRSRYLRLAIKEDGSCVVTAPPFVSHHLIEEFLSKKSEWILSKIAYFKAHPQSQPKSKSQTKKEFELHKKNAHELVSSRLRYFNQFYGYSWNTVTVRNQKSRWGSCSKRKNLNFNYKLFLLPKELADYVVVHELCHLAQMNHSQKFWDLVAKTIPNHKVLRRELRKIAL